MRSVRLLVPISFCNDAAPILIQALGGPEQANAVVGGTRWWQVRGLQGIDANWVAAKKDIEAIRKLRRQGSRSASSDSNNTTPGAASSQKGKEKATGEGNDEASYATEMDSMPCMYYFHGGMRSFQAMKPCRRKRSAYPSRPRQPLVPI